MAYSSPASVSAGTVAPATWGNSVKAAADYLANPPSCRVYNSADISLPNGTFTVITFNQERHDTASMHSTSVNTSRITIPDAGLYLITGHLAFASNATGIRAARIQMNGVTVLAAHMNLGTTSASAESEISISTVYKFAAAAYIELYAFQNSGGALNTMSRSNYAPEFSATWIGLG